MAVKWCIRFPGRLRAELSALGEIGSGFKLSISDLKLGRITISGIMAIDGSNREVTIKYPDLYPYFRCEVYIPSLDLEHHQNPFEKNICLLSASTAEWYLTDTAADLLREQLPKVLKAGKSENKEEVAGLEEIQGEPLTTYLVPRIQNASVFIDSSWNIDSSTKLGRLTLGCRTHGYKYQWAVKEVRNYHGTILAQGADEINNVYAEELKGFWVRHEGKIRTSDPAQLFDIIDTAFPNKHYRTTPGLYGILFEDETGWREKGDGWIFLLVASKAQADELSRIYRLTDKKILRQPLLVRTLRAGADDFCARTPELTGLSEKSILIVGLGCLGAPSALEFARSGVGRLVLWDSDIVEPGTITRWPLGLPYAGLLKVELANFISCHYPFCKVSAAPPLRIGGLRHYHPGLPNEWDMIDDQLKDINLIFDASAEIGVQRVLSDIAHEKKIPYIKISATPGFWGGEVARIVPHDTKGCWLCLYQSQFEGLLPKAPEAPNGTIYATGCCSRTYTGASFDGNIIAMTGVRLAIATLLGNSGGYPDFPWDVAVISLRDPNGNPVPPQFQTFILEKNERCPRGRS